MYVCMYVCIYYCDKIWVCILLITGKTLSYQPNMSFCYYWILTCFGSLSPWMFQWIRIPFVSADGELASRKMKIHSYGKARPPWAMISFGKPAIHALCRCKSTHTNIGTSCSETVSPSNVTSVLYLSTTYTKGVSVIHQPPFQKHLSQ